MKNVFKTILVMALFVIVSSFVLEKTYAADPLNQSFQNVDIKETRKDQFKQWNYSSGSYTYVNNYVYATSDLRVSINYVKDRGTNWEISVTTSGEIRAASDLWAAECCSSFNTSLYINGTYVNYESRSYNKNYYAVTYYGWSPRTMIMTVPKEGMKLNIRVGAYASANTSSGYNGFVAAAHLDYTRSLNLNNVPGLTVDQPNNQYYVYLNGQEGCRTITVSGKVHDKEGNSVVLKARINNIEKTLTFPNPPTSPPGSNNYTFTWDTETEGFTDKLYTDLYVTATDSFNDSSYSWTPFRVTIDRMKPTISVLSSKVKGGTSISVNSNEISTIYIVRDGVYTKQQLDAEVNGLTGTKGNVTSPNAATTITAPTMDGYYRAFAVDRSHNISLISSQIIVVDKTSPKLVSATIEGNSLIIAYDEVLNSSILPAESDFFATEGSNILSVSKTVLVNEEEVIYDTGYNDFEADPQLTEEWTYVHDKNYYENAPAQTADFSGLILHAPITAFNLVGKYDLTYRAQDNPPPDGAAFDQYRRWSKTDRMTLYVHRKPTAQFIVSAVASGSNYLVHVIDISYDEDHKSAANRGIVQREWKWKTENDTAWTNGMIPTTVPNNKKYIVKLRVKDREGAWSEEVSEYIDRQIPDALDFTATLNPSYPNPVLVGTDIGLNVEIVTTGTISSVMARLEGESNKSLTFSGNGPFSGMKLYGGNYNVRSTKPARDYYTMYVTVTLTSGKTLAKEYKVNVITNRPPAVDFDWSPKPVWEGDTVQLLNQTTDPDGDVLTYKWEIEDPALQMSVSAAANVIQRFSLPGLYKVKLTASDGMASVTAVKWLQASELTLKAEVNHTPQWLINHRESGHEVAEQPKDFYSGEVFVVEAESSEAPVKEVTAWVDTAGKDNKSILVSVRLTAASASQYIAELFDERWMAPASSLPNGLLAIYFRIEYQNGIIKEETVTVRIIDNVYKAAGVHRRQ